MVGFKHCAAYAASKFAVEGLSLSVAAEGNVQDTWSAYNGRQQGDPAKLGEALVKIAGMTNPPKQFHAGSDALAVVTPALDARLQEIKEHEELSKSTDGTF